MQSLEIFYYNFSKKVILNKNYWVLWWLSGLKKFKKAMLSPIKNQINLELEKEKH